jgi:four helix bundle protein
MNRSFRDLVAFKRSLEVVVAIYRKTESFPRSELYGLVSQMRRASIGVISQIAEGEGRLTFGEWRQFLSQAQGSLYEVESQVIASRELGFISASDETELSLLIRGAGRAVSGLIRWVQMKESEQKKDSHQVTRSAKNKGLPDRGTG